MSQSERATPCALDSYTLEPLCLCPCACALTPCEPPSVPVPSALYVLLCAFILLCACSTASKHRFLSYSPALVSALTMRMLNYSDLDLRDVIGSGTYGRVRLAHLFGMKVAVKEFFAMDTPGPSQASARAAILSEVAIMARLPVHDNLLPLVGVAEVRGMVFA